MKIGDVKPSKNKINLSVFTKVIIGTLLVLLVFLSGALFQQRGFDVKLYKFIEEFKYILVSETNQIQNNSLSTLYIDIPFKSLEKIYQKRDDALKVGILLTSDEDFVPAQIRLDQGKELDVEIRLKGDWTDHIETNKWSYRVHVKNDGAILGTKRFSIQAPETRNYEAEWYFHQHCMYEGILTTKYTFLNVYENGTYKGVYAFEESFSEELLANQEKREGIILKLDEDFYWSNRSAYTEKNNYWEAAEENLFDTSESILSSEVDVFRENHLENNLPLSNQKEYAVGLLTAYIKGEIPATQVFDVEKFGKYYALLDFWAANHAAHWINIRFYFNPVTGLMEPIVYDGIPFLGKYNQNFLGYTFNELPIFEVPEVRASYYKELIYLTQSSDFNSFMESVKTEGDTYNKILEREYSSMDSVWNQLETRRKLISTLINPQFPARGSYYKNSIDGEDYVILNLKNLTIFPLEIKEIKIGEKVFSFDDIIQNESIPNNLIFIDKKAFLDFNKTVEELSFPEIQIKIPVDSEDIINSNDVNVVVQIPGVGQSKKIALSNIPSIFDLGLQIPQNQSPDIASVLNEYPFLELGLDENLYVKPGIWDIDSDLVIPKNITLNLLPGAHLRFAESALLLINGGSLNIRGTQDNYSSISSVGDFWPGILIIDAKEESNWQYAEISNLKGFEREGWMVTGGITFYQSNVSISDSIITNSISEDAINIIHSEFTFNNFSITRASSDAFDSDFSNGSIVDSFFNQITGDAIDISGSNITVSNCFFDLIGDKGLSAGEQSDINAKNLHITNTNIGVASKDLSNVTIEDSEIIDSTFIAFAAYQKKSIFGPGSIEGKNIQVNTPEKLALNQIGSSISINNEIISGVEMDVSTLYDLGILGN